MSIETVPLAEVAAAATTPAEPGGDDASWQRLAYQLEADNRRLEQERDHWKGEAERYHAGLERAVGELNRLSGESAAARAAAQAAQAAAAHPVRVHTLGAPTLQIIGDEVLVTGRLRNSGDREATGRLLVEVLADGVVVRALEQHLLVPANGDVAFSERFALMTRNGVTYTARARPSY